MPASVFGGLETPPNKGLDGAAFVAAVASPSLKGEAAGVVLGTAEGVNPPNGDVTGFAAGASVVFVVSKSVAEKAGLSVGAASAGFAGSNIDFAGASAVKPPKGDVFGCSVVAGFANVFAAGVKAGAVYIS